MPASLELRGLDDLIAALAALPADLRREADREVLDAANDVAAEIRSAYPNVSGDLRGQVVVRQLAGTNPFDAVASVVSGSEHAQYYEFGSQVRQTALGWNRGRMPAKPTVVPAVMRRRRRLMTNLIAILEREGMAVRGAI